MLPRHLPKQNTRETADTADMLTGFQAPVFNDRGKAVNQRGVGFPYLSSLLLHQLFQMQLMPIEFHGVLNPPFHRPGLKGLCNNIRRPQIEDPDLALGSMIGGNDNDGDAGQRLICRHLLQHRITVLHRHQQIQQHGGDPFPVPPHQRQSLRAVLRLKDLIFALEQSAKDCAVDLHIIHQQQRIAGLHHRALPTVGIRAQPFPPRSSTVCSPD
ncbi:hypothetical protein SDC9_87000 [bioreactor metagenome]|uniref:Uncharacterized protein n=1 Tax=bioreactor metagenome TaxID=1076179 RepID=A0A644ZHL8_9ZZZZ